MKRLTTNIISIKKTTRKIRGEKRKVEITRLKSGKEKIRISRRRNKRKRKQLLKN